jgi:WD40 repeat protein
MAKRITCPSCYQQFDDGNDYCPFCEFPIHRFKSLLSGKPVIYDHELIKEFNTLIEKHREIAKKKNLEPILKIETGMHTAPIRRIGIDSAERFLVTGSDDKTIKVWELKRGKLIKTLRPPIGNGKEGKSTQ